MSPFPATYQRIEFPGSAATSQAWYSTSSIDPLWDHFLRCSPQGQFQQSSLWAEFKAGEGWQHHRVIVTDADTSLIGGFQILWKRKGPVRIGYVSKGPVLAATRQELAPGLARLLTQSARNLRLIALIMQAPDDSDASFTAAFKGAGYLESNPLHVVEATYRLDLTPDLETLRAQMSASLRRNLRKARKQPVKIVEGTEQDLEKFFDLMTATCRRQQTSPNPPSVGAIRRLWGLFAPHRLIRITLAECDGQIPAGKLSLPFGHTLTVWKKGWDGSHPAFHPNELLEDEAIEWARQQGFRWLDFCSFNRPAAERILAGEPADALSLSSRDEYHLRFGGAPHLLPPALLWLPNPLLRWAYRKTFMLRENMKRQKSDPRT